MVEYQNKLGDLSIEITVNGTNLPTTQWQPEDYRRKNNEIDFEEPIYSLIPYNSGSYYLEIALKNIDKDDVVEIEYSYTYQADQCFQKVDDFTTRFEVVLGTASFCPTLILLFVNPFAFFRSAVRTLNFSAIWLTVSPFLTL